MFSAHLRVLSVAMAATFLFSCGKESSVEPDAKPSSPITGNYKIVSFYQKGRSQTTVKIGSEVDMTVNDFVFKGSDFTGTYTIDEKNISTNNVGYTASGPITMKSYTNGVPDGDDFTMNFSQPLPPSSASGPYTLRGDSVYSAPLTGSSATGVPLNNSGLADIYAQHYMFSGDTLIIDGNINIANRTTVVQGYTATLSGTNYIIVKLLRLK